MLQRYHRMHGSRRQSNLRALHHALALGKPFIEWSRLKGLLRALHPGDDAPSLMQVYLAGCGGGIASFFLSTPTELIKIKAQVSRSNKSVWDVSRQIYRQHGLGGFYQGGWITLIRDTPSYGIYFWVYEGMKRALQVQDYEDSGTQQAWKLLLAGGLAGTISWSSIYPIDVIKSRLQMQSIPSSSVSLLPISPIVHSSPTSSFSSATLQHTSAAVDDPLLQHQQKISHAHSATHFTSIRDCVVRSYRSEGISVFFRGLGPTVLRAFPVNAVTFWVYELVIGWLSGK
ncbi:mitochondrial carrier [Hesseltinella vesiculosa]|uniref:Mitochondrial carrier n=1 Tax=Hesseltinella vesiculosa TaxID=101127 RepID=A0A1X2GND2_9FUNG|nr:mitochondrial carrier [Hesseltinella vesiculosa]